jgi:hypothetical protein
MILVEPSGIACDLSFPEPDFGLVLLLLLLLLLLTSSVQIHELIAVCKGTFERAA